MELFGKNYDNFQIKIAPKPMKKCNLLILLILLCTSAKAQKYFATTFDKLPQNYQLYPRDAKSEAIVPISGKIEEAGWEYFSVQIFRNKLQIDYQKAPITYTNSVGKFSFSSIKIKAEKAEYDVNIYAVKGKDSVNLVNRENIVAGDVYVISGQSNATTFFQDYRTNEFCRTFGKNTLNFGNDNGNPADTLWALSNQDLYYQGVGYMGFEFQKILLDTYGIPTCLINGGFHASSMLQHSTRTANNPADLTNGYGRMLYRLQKAGVAQAVKALIYRQGEKEAWGESSNWGGYFDIFYKNFKLDLPSIKQLYLFQIDIVGFTDLQSASALRDIQRTESDKYPDIQVLASIGTSTFDGLHYQPDGYKQNALEISRLAGKDFYNATDTDNITSPNIRKAYFSKIDKSEITLVFDKDQVLSWTEQVRNLMMINQFYLDGKTGGVKSGIAKDNLVVLTLNNVSTANLISYLPPFIANTSPDYPYIGPYLKNSRGMRALTFFEVKIESFGSNLPVPVVTYSKIPQNLQLFPRNSKNEAIVTITGKIETLGYDALSLTVYRNNTTAKYYKTPLIYSENVSNFTYSHTIKAELANYNFKIYAIKGTDSVLVSSRENIVAGDAYLINGQSNALAWGLSNTFPNSNYQNEFCRTFGQTKTGNNFITTADTSWAYSNVGKPYVGVWGIELQKQIVEKYAIPTCFLNEAVFASAITEHTARNATNPADVTNIYGRLLYRAKKSGLADNIKGFFYWQGEAEALAKPAIWKTEFDKLYNFWKTDFPTLSKYYIFQINILGLPVAEAGDLRDFQRQIKKNYPKTQVIASIGNTGYDGTHYSVDGYKKIASEAFRMVSRDFYGATDTLQILSPNVQKAYYANLAKDEIVILFEDAQKLIWTADSTYNQDNGTAKKYFLKDYIYLNNATDKVLSGRADNNKIIIKTSGFTTNQSITYLPAYFPINYAIDQRGIFGGPFLKNQRGMNAFSFDKLVISDPLSPPTLSSKIQTATSVQLSWKEISNASAYQLEIKDLNLDKYTIVQTLPKGTTTFLSDNLLGSTNYTFRIKTIADKLESEYSTLQIQTPKALDLPKLKVESTYFDEVKLTEAVNYVVERKNPTTNGFEQIAKLGQNVLEYQDKSLIGNTLYTYRIKGIGTFTESPFASIDIKTLANLSQPDLSLTVINFNSLRVDWKAIPNATSYILERKAPNKDYQIWGVFEPTVFSFTDKDLLPSTTYSYRLKALSPTTESIFVSIDGRTPAMLEIPQMDIIPTSFDTFKITWKLVPNATKYVLERKDDEKVGYKEIAKLGATQTEYLDDFLKLKTTYFYRLKALGDKTESEFVELKSQTTAILKTEEEIFNGFSLFPNPAHSHITLRFDKPMTGQISLIDLRGVELLKKEIVKVSESIIPVNNYQSGVYFLSFKNEDGVISRKLIIE
jgi:Secretion system C-terminal sorting domain/Carbohydrate esterase, sialic acid-specific acetylesterase/Fibronectin type III domain